MKYRPFGNTGIDVSVLGFGGGHIGDPNQDEKMIERILNALPELGINLIDTARSYGESEYRIGKYLSHRRSEFVLSTKVGYTYHDKPDWSYEATIGTIEESLIRLKTDYIDIVHLHSCEKWVLERGEAITALEKAREQGKIRVIAYSGENDALAYAIESKRFGSIQCSVNLVDQKCLEWALPEATALGMGIIAKRPLGNAVWRYHSRPDGHGHAEYYDRFHKMKPYAHGLSWNELALRFSAFTPHVSAIITGTSSIKHLKENISFLEKGDLPLSLTAHIRNSFTDIGINWQGLI
ncbi:MAG: aldo/keto reductase [Bacteroidetes bacterium]|nr:aldo/keto reductase [Bacteroidota bacterium]